MLLLLSALAATTLYVSRTNAVLVRRSFEFAQAQAAADAAIVYTLSNLSDEQVTRHGPIDGTARTWQFDGAHVSVTVTNEAGRIDVNAADDNLIFAFLMSQGVDQDEGKNLVQDLRQWQQIGGRDIETKSSRTANAPTPPNLDSTHPLETIEELSQIPSWRNQPLGCWNDTLTVYSGLPGVNSLTATKQSLAALEWAEAHHLGDKEWIQASAASARSNEPRSLVGDILRIQVHAIRSDNVSASAEWVGRLTGNADNPALTMRWSHALQPLNTVCGARPHDSTLKDEMSQGGRGSDESQQQVRGRVIARLS